MLEVVTMLATIVLLIALCLPSIASTHLKSEVTVCVSNQRQLIQGALMFAQDNQDALLPAYFTMADGLSVPLFGGGYWPGPTQVIGASLTREAALDSVGDGLRRGPLWQFTKAVQVYHCPGDQRMFLMKPGAGWGYDSYSKAEGMGGASSWPGIKWFKRIAEVPNPAMSFVFCEEADPRGFNGGTWILDVSPPGWVDAFGAFHDGGAQFSFLDGHVDLNRWRDPRTLSTAKSMTKGVAAFYAPGGDAKNSDFRWVWDRFQQVNWKPLK